MDKSASSSLLANLFHSFPHVDFNFYNTTLKFTPDNLQYQQALFFNGIYLFFTSFALFIILSIYFLVCSCYFCTKCANPIFKPRPSRSRCLRLLVGILAVFSSVALGVGFYGNNKIQDGVDNFSTATVNVYDRFDLFKFKDVVIERYLEVGTMEYFKKLENKIFLKYGNQSADMETLKDKLITMSMSMQTSGNLLKDANINLKLYAEQFQLYDQYRWWLLLGILCWHILTLLITFYAVYTEQRCPFVVLTVMSVLSFLFISSSVGLHTPISIGAADLCLDPKTAILQYIHEVAPQELVKYYMDCEENSAHQQIIQTYKETDFLLKESLDIISLLAGLLYIQKLNGSQILLDGMNTSLTSSKNTLDELTSIMDCSYINKEYSQAVYNVCQTTLNGLGLSLLASLLMILFLVCTFFFISPIWQAIAPLRPILKRDKYGVHFITESYQGPPGGSDSFHGSSSFDVSYKSIEDREDFEHVPLISSQRGRRPPTVWYQAIHGSTEFLSVEEDTDRRSNHREHTM